MKWSAALGGMKRRVALTETRGGRFTLGEGWAEWVGGGILGRISPGLMMG